EGLRKDFPHTNVEPQNADARIALRDGGSWEVDLLINASGDETLGLLINEKLHGSLPIVHCWNDPMSMGGHVLSTFPGAQNCYQCIFPRDADTGAIYNAASFVERGQDVTSSFAGCAGV